MKITPINQPGQILLALRAGRMESTHLSERFSFASGWLHRMNAEGLIERNEDMVWSITPAGRAACPNRRDAKMEPMHTCKTSKSRAHGWSSTRQQQGATA